MSRGRLVNRSWLLAIALAVGIAAWLWSGMQAPSSVEKPAADAAPTPRTSTVSVRVRAIEAESVEREIVVNGRTEPARAVSLRAELEARVVAIGAERGVRVAGGDVIARLDLRDLESQLARARATLAQRELQHEAAKRLERQNYQSQTEVAEAFANLQSAKAAIAEVRTRLENAVIRAPFNGILDRRPVEIGDFLREGDEVARLIEINPLLITGDVAQHERHRIKVGDPGVATLVTGEQVEGRIRYVSSEADEATRTFRIELEVANADARLVSGVTAELRVVTGTALAHRMSPALLALDADHRLGVKSVNDAGKVVFHPVEIVRSSPEGLWVSGLPRTLRVITVGHGFVRDGDAVNAVPESMVNDDSRSMRPPVAMASTPDSEKKSP